MSVPDDFTEYILDLLQPIEGIKITKMFGGVLLKVGDRQLGILIGDAVYFKVTDLELHERYKKEGSKQFEYFRKDKKNPVVIKNWWLVPEYAMDSSEEMVQLAEEVLDQK